MTGHEFFTSCWWIFPLAMIIFCIFFMKKDCGKMMFGFNAHNGTDESAIEILNKRFAKGDIDQREYEERKKKLT